LLLLDRDGLLSDSLSSVTSMDNLLLSPWELLMSRLKLTRLERLRPNAADDTETGRCSRRLGWDSRGFGEKTLSLVIVELLDVRDGIS